VDQPARRGASSGPRVAIIGAGLGGIAQAANLVQRGLGNFVIFEKSDGPGGTWWDNRYPGAACDVPSVLYSYDFMLMDWDRTHATQAELQAYIEHVIDKFGFRDRLRTGTAVERVVWDDRTSTYELVTSRGDTERFNVVVSAVGMLNVPNEMTWPGLDSFAGLAFHSARWKPEYDLAGKRVAVVGAGASAAQIVPALAPVVSHLVSFQREANWVTPKNDHVLSADERQALAGLRRKRGARKRTLRAIDKGLRVGVDVNGPAALAAREAGRAYIAKVFADRPDLAQMLTPDYPLRCKRAVVSSDFLPALTRENVQVVPRAVTAVRPHAIVDDQGADYPVDVIVMATGFQATNYLATLEVVGRDGRKIHDVWDGDPNAFLGLTVPGFPNFYMLYGPNTHGTVVSYVLERQAEFVARDVARLRRRRAGRIEVRPAAAAWYQRVLGRGLETVAAWTADCHSYYHSATGRNVTQWPWSHGRYKLWTRALRVPSSRIGGRGVWVAP
jgi:cation diffusion facilitator CzcD-associated flavoprotein CzcO